VVILDQIVETETAAGEAAVDTVVETSHHPTKVDALKEAVNLNNKALHRAEEEEKTQEIVEESQGLDERQSHQLKFFNFKILINLSKFILIFMGFWGFGEQYVTERSSIRKKSYHCWSVGIESPCGQTLGRHRRCPPEAGFPGPRARTPSGPRPSRRAPFRRQSRRSRGCRADSGTVHERFTSLGSSKSFFVSAKARSIRRRVRAHADPERGSPILPGGA
jgi:hypothetical protein